MPQKQYTKSFLLHAVGVYLNHRFKTELLQTLGSNNLHESISFIKCSLVFCHAWLIICTLAKMTIINYKNTSLARLPQSWYTFILILNQLLQRTIAYFLARLLQFGLFSFVFAQSRTVITKYVPKTSIIQIICILGMLATKPARIIFCSCNQCTLKTTISNPNNYKP
jgi:hypothetical protein